MRGVVLNERVRANGREWKRGNPGFTSQKMRVGGVKKGSMTGRERRVDEGRRVQNHLASAVAVISMPSYLIVSENNAIYKDRVGRNFGVAQFSCMATGQSVSRM